MQANGKYPIPVEVTTIGGLDCAAWCLGVWDYLPAVEHLKNLLDDQEMKVQEAASIPEVWLTAYQLLKMVL